MRAPTFSILFSSLGHLVELLRMHQISVAIRFPEWPGEFECDFRRGLSKVSTHGYRIGDEVRFDFCGSESLACVVLDCIRTAGGTDCDQDRFLAGWAEIAPRRCTTDASNISQRKSETDSLGMNRRATGALLPSHKICRLATERSILEP